MDFMSSNRRCRLTVFFFSLTTIYYGVTSTLACDFHHDPAQLASFDPDDNAKFWSKLEKAEQDCEDDIEKKREDQCARTGEQVEEQVQQVFQNNNSTSTNRNLKCSSATSDPNFAFMETMAWSRFGFRAGRMPPAFSDATKMRGATGSYVSQEQGEGAGARVRRSIGRPELKNMDPFLMLDEFKVGLPAGFPDHPHRGMTHEDSKGNAGTLGPSDLQWMTAAKGIMHSEVPETRKEAHGLQMWINLPRSEKMAEPEYQEIPAKDLARAEAADDSGKTIQVAIAAGESLGVTSQVRTRTPCYLIHVKMGDKGSTFRQALPVNFTAFLYTLEGCEITVRGDGSKVQDRSVLGHTTVTLQSNVQGQGVKEGVEVVAEKKDSEFVLVAAQPIGEPIVQYGPFVMTSQAEIQDAFRDYQTGRNGFEGAQQWESQNRRRMGR
ncbi:unnamed protein product [Amoebophrya sp. A25]|nr:unnamed protein product [Amoebophrya sp. A25]|eukprot:GSA25T00024485001.1